MGSRTIGVAVVAALLVTAGLASAQSFTVAVEAQEEPGQLSAGDSASVPLTVQLQGDGFSCAQEEQLPVQLSVTGGSAGVSGTVDPAELMFGNTMGVHSAQAPDGGYNQSGEATLSIDTQSSASGSSELTVTGLFPGGNYAPPNGSCSGEFPSAEDTATVPVTVQSANDGNAGGADGGDGSGGGDGNQTGGDGSEGEDGSGIPLGPWLAPAGLIAAAFFVRRS